MRAVFQFIPLLTLLLVGCGEREPQLTTKQEITPQEKPNRYYNNALRLIKSALAKDGEAQIPELKEAKEKLDIIIRDLSESDLARKINEGDTKYTPDRIAKMISAAKDSESQRLPETINYEIDSIEPGNIELERGESLAILTFFKNKAPNKATLTIKRAGKISRQLELAKNLNDPILGVTLPGVEEAFAYQIEFDGKKSLSYQVKVYEHPTLMRADVALTFPPESKLPSFEQKDARRITAISGTKLEYVLSLNKAVAKARLVAGDDSFISLSVEPEKPEARLKGFILRESKRYRLELIDSDGRKNKIAPLFEFLIR